MHLVQEAIDGSEVEVCKVHLLDTHTVDALL